MIICRQWLNVLLKKNSKNWRDKQEISFLKKYLKYSLLFFIFCGIIIASYACFVEPFRLVVTSYTVETDKWTSDKPLKIVLLADIHSINPWMTPAHLDKIIEETNKLNPDIVLLLGDYVATHPFGVQVPPEDGVRPYKNIKSVCGVYAILGNHDLHKSKGWPEAFAKTGIPILRNDAQKIQCEAQSFWIAGLDEWRLGHVDISKTIKKVSDNDSIILMTHNPDAFVEIPETIALTVAGHTHGGQIRLPFLGAVSAVIPSKYGLRYAYGHIQENGKDLVVSSGLGMTGIPLRFLDPPEITVVNLTRAPKK